MASGAKLPASGLMTHMPMVNTRKNVPMNSTRYLFMTILLVVWSPGGARSRVVFAFSLGRRRAGFFGRAPGEQQHECAKDQKHGAPYEFDVDAERMDFVNALVGERAENDEHGAKEAEHDA